MKKENIIDKNRKKKKKKEEEEECWLELFNG
jgi:hypothetical protein